MPQRLSCYYRRARGHDRRSALREKRCERCDSAFTAAKERSHRAVKLGSGRLPTAHFAHCDKHRRERVVDVHGQPATSPAAPPTLGLRPPAAEPKSTRRTKRVKPKRAKCDWRGKLGHDGPSSRL